MINISLELISMNLLQSYLPLFSSYFRDKFIRFNLFFALGTNIVMWLWLFWQTRDFSGHIALHYNIYFGIDSFGPWPELFYLPALGLLFLGLNLSLGGPSYEKERNLAYFLSGIASFNQIILLIALYLIIFINS